MINKAKLFVLDTWPSFLYVAIIVFLPWETVRGSEFADLLNYIKRIEVIRLHGDDYFSWEWTLLGLLKFEFIWFQIISLAANNNFEAEVFLKLITAICAFNYHNYLRGKLGSLLSLVILINPITIDLLLSQVRSALAFSLFILLTNSKIKNNKFINKGKLIFILPFIHTAMIYVIFIYYFALISSKIKKINDRVKLLLMVTATVILAIFISLVIPIAGEAIGDRRDFSEFPNKSLAYLSFWMFMGLMLMLKKNGLQKPSWEYYFAIMICLSSCAMEVLGFPGFRFIALSIPIIFFSLIFVKKDVRKFTYLVASGYSTMLFGYWVL